MPRTYTWTKLRLQKLVERKPTSPSLMSAIEISRECVLIFYNLDTQEDALEVALYIAEKTGLTCLDNGYKYMVSRATVDSITRINTR
jgi:hypothetical protein